MWQIVRTSNVRGIQVINADGEPEKLPLEDLPFGRFVSVMLARNLCRAVFEAMVRDRAVGAALPQ